MGFIEETGAAQHYRDARIAPIYEGTNGIQAIDLVTRKLPLAGGAVVEAYLGELRAHRRGGERDQRSRLRPGPACGSPEAADSLSARTHWLLGALDKERRRRARRRHALSAAVRLAAGGCMLAQQALAALRLDADAGRRASRWRGSLPRTVRSRPGALERTVVECAPGLLGADARRLGAENRLLGIMP